jgi:hypothetical protein
MAARRRLYGSAAPSRCGATLRGANLQESPPNTPACLPTPSARAHARRMALADAIAHLEGGQGTVVTSSGLAAVTLALSAVLRGGDHFLMPDTIYGPTRDFCDMVLTRFGVGTTYYDPCLRAGVAAVMRSNTRVVFTESPGSLTFDVQDIPTIVAVAHARHALVLIDNTWLGCRDATGAGGVATEQHTSDWPWMVRWVDTRDIPVETGGVIFASERTIQPATMPRPHVQDSDSADPVHTSLPERFEAAEPTMPASPASAGHAEAAGEATRALLPGTHAVG